MIKGIKFWMIAGLLISIVITAIGDLSKKDLNCLMLSLLAAIALFIPFFIEKLLGLRFTTLFEIMLTAYIYSSFFLGAALVFYDRFWWWDIVLHCVSGLFLGNIGLALTGASNAQAAAPKGSRDRKSEQGVLLRAAFCFCFALSAGAVWEIYEYSMDQIFNMNMQYNSLQDTMTDLIFDAAGSLVFAGLAYLQLKGRLRFLAIFTGSAKISDRAA